MSFGALFLLLSAIPKGFSIFYIFNPPSNTVVRHEINATNVIFVCVIFNPDAVQLVTQWNIGNYRGVRLLQDLLTAVGSSNVRLDGTPRDDFFVTHRELAIFNMYTQDLAGADLYCGISDNITAGVFHLGQLVRVTLLNFTKPMRYISGNTTLSISLESAGQEGIPYPTDFRWSKGGEALRNDSRRMFANFSATFSHLEPSDNGIYSLMATNYHPGTTTMFSTGSGYFVLDILYGPSFVRGPEMQAVPLGETLSLLCAANLSSNPQPVVTWVNPYGDNIGNSIDDRFTPRITGNRVELVIEKTTLEDEGWWNCSIRVLGMNFRDLNGSVVKEATLIGEESASVQLVVVVAPGKPTNLVSYSKGDSWIYLGWQQPIFRGAVPPNYAIQATDNTDSTTFTVTGITNNRNNLSDLLPSTNYRFRVRAVSQVLGVENFGVFSDVYSVSTIATVPSLVCNVTQVVNDSIIVRWTLLYMGDNNDRIVSRVSYTINSDTPRAERDDASIGLDQRSARIPLTPEATFQIVVIVTNSVGSTMVECPSITTMRATTSLPTEDESTTAGAVPVIMKVTLTDTACAVLLILSSISFITE